MFRKKLVLLMLLCMTLMLLVRDLFMRLNKEKLRLKEVIERLKGEMIPDLNA